MKKLKFIVSGTSRSGTMYMAKLLTSLGFECGHESIFTTDGLDEALQKIAGKKKITNSICAHKNGFFINQENLCADSSYLSAPFLGHQEFKDVKIIHVVRNPIKVISSTLIDANFFSNDAQRPFVNFVETYLPELKNISNFKEKAMYYYVNWNLMVQKNCTNVNYKKIVLENGVSEEFFSFIGVQQTHNYHQDNKTNCWHNRKKDLEISDLPNGEIKNSFLKIMDAYGYPQKKIYLI